MVATLLLSLALGLVVGTFYGLTRFDSPAPPPVALVGLAGIVIGQWLIRLIWR